MALVPVYRPWLIDKDGAWQLDARGHRIDDPRVGTRMAEKDLNEAERAHIAHQDRVVEHSKLWKAANLIAGIEDAKKTLGK